MKTQQPMTFAQLKAALEALTPEQLAMPVRWWGEERAGKILGLDVLDEDYLSDGDEYCCPRSQFVQDTPDGTSEEEMEVVYVKGQPVLSEIIPYTKDDKMPNYPENRKDNHSLFGE